MGTALADPAALRRAFAHVPSAVVALCADTGGERTGMAVSTFVPISLDPPLVAISVQNTSGTWPRLAVMPRLGISVLNATHAMTVRALAAKTEDRFADVDTETAESGALFIRGCGLHMDASVRQQIPAGDHTIVVMDINTLHLHDHPDHAIEPIIFHRSGFRTLVTS